MTTVKLLLGFIMIYGALGMPHASDQTSRPTSTPSTTNAPHEVKSPNSDSPHQTTAGPNIGADGEHHRPIRDIDCIDSPPNVQLPCILCNGESSVEVTDAQGYTCDCLVCHPATYMKSECKCRADGQVDIDTECKVLEPGMGYMPETNVCELPYPCSECPGDLISVSDCGGTVDTTCDCPEGTFQTGPTTCKDIPRCNVGFHKQLVYNEGSDYTSYECVLCPEGMYQPFNNTLDLCRRRPNNTISTTQTPLVSTKGPPSTDDSKETDGQTESPLPRSPEGTCASPCTCNCPNSTVDTTGKDATKFSIGNMCNAVLAATVGVLLILFIPACVFGKKILKSIWSCLGNLFSCIKCKTSQQVYNSASQEDEENQMVTVKASNGHQQSNGNGTVSNRSKAKRKKKGKSKKRTSSV